MNDRNDFPYHKIYSKLSQLFGKDANLFIVLIDGNKIRLKLKSFITYEKFKQLRQIFIKKGGKVWKIFGFWFWDISLTQLIGTQSRELYSHDMLASFF